VAAEGADRRPRLAPARVEGRARRGRRESALLKELTRERALGFQLLKGVKWPHARQES
jgi:hypothetical protein